MREIRESAGMEFAHPKWELARWLMERTERSLRKRLQDDRSAKTAKKRSAIVEIVQAAHAVSATPR